MKPTLSTHAQFLQLAVSQDFSWPTAEVKVAP